jgi:hypothetical protein
MTKSPSQVRLSLRGKNTTGSQLDSELIELKSKQFQSLNVNMDTILTNNSSRESQVTGGFNVAPQNEGKPQTILLSN